LVGVRVVVADVGRGGRIEAAEVFEFKGPVLHGRAKG
jgi:hypothetical protein